MSDLSHRAPPEIEPGVTVDSLSTVEDCDAALDRVTMSIASIEDQLGRIHRNSPNQPHDWRSRAEKSLRIKKLLLPRLQQRRADLKREAKARAHAATMEAYTQTLVTKDRALVKVMYEVEPDAAARVFAIAQDRHPELFGEGA